MIRAWALDDEPLALRRLVRMLEETGRVQVVGHATDPTEALERLNTSSVDALFLDIEMPGLNGFDLLQRLTVSPAIVFTTAFDRYAVKAFEANGTDYLLKPITPEALARAVARLEQKASPAPADYRAMLEKLSGALAQNTRQYARRLPSKLGDRVQLIDLDKVTHFYAERKLTYAATADKAHVVDDSIVQLEAKLDPAQFHRIHRSYMVNLVAVAEICSWFGGRMVARLNDTAKTELPISRDHVRSLKDRLGF